MSKFDPVGAALKTVRLLRKNGAEWEQVRASIVELIDVAIAVEKAAEKVLGKRVDGGK